MTSRPSYRENSGTQCGRCGRAIDAAVAVYSTSGALSCAPCLAAEGIGESGERTKKRVPYTLLFPFFALAVALSGSGASASFEMSDAWSKVGILIAFVSIVSLTAIVLAIGGMVFLRRPDNKAALGAAYGWGWAASILALALGSIQLLFAAFHALITSMRMG